MRVRRPFAVLVASGLLLGLLSTVGVSPVLAATCDGSSSSLQDGGFETPPVAPDTFTFFPAASVPPWQTTDSLGDIEIWGTGFNGVPASAGNAFAEINANSAGTLYQDVITNPGDTMTWTLDHRGRAGADSMQVLIGDATVADVNGSAGWDFVSADLTDDTSAWGTHTDTYLVPAGQVCTRFAFRAVSTASGNDSIGNFLDAVSFSIAPAPTPTPTTGPTATPEPTPTDPGVVVTPPATTTAPPSDPGEPAPSMVPFAAVLLGASAGLWLLSRRPERRRRR